MRDKAQEETIIPTKTERTTAMKKHQAEYLALIALDKLLYGDNSDSKPSADTKHIELSSLNSMTKHDSQTEYMDSQTN